MEQKKKRFPAGRLAGVLLIVLIVVGLTHPQLAFFLSPQQQEAMAAFQRDYFDQVNPLSSSNGLDPLRLAAAALLLAEAWAITMIVSAAGRRLKFRDRHAETIKGLILNLLRYAVVIFAVIFALSALGINMGAVIASLGILSLVVGFGAQTLIEDVITGLFMIFEGQFHVGDIITVDGFRGTVTSIGIRTTNIMDAGGNIKIINNSDIRTLINLSEVTSMAVVTVSIAYGAPLEKAERILVEELERLAQELPDVFLEPPAYVGVEALAASSVDLKVIAKVTENNIYAARRMMNRAVKLAFDAGGIEIPFPQLVVHQGND